MSEHRDLGDPLRERELPNAELMLTRILDDAAQDTVAFEALEDLDAPTHRRPLLYALAAAVLVVALGTLGWLVVRPQETHMEPAGRPGAFDTAPAAPATPTPEVVPDPGAVPSPAPTTQAPAPQRTPAPTPTSSPTRPAASPTPTQTTSPRSTPTPTTFVVTGDRLAIVSATRGESAQAGQDYAYIELQACPGTRGATLTGPYVSGGVRSDLPDYDPLGNGTLVNRNTCLPISVRALVPQQTTTVTITVEFTYADEYASHNGPRSDSATIS